MDSYESLLELCRRRKSIRSFTDEPIRGEEIDRIREVAATSPYASGKKNWELLVVTDRALIAELASVVEQRCAELAGRVREDFREGFLGYARNFRCFESAPSLFIPTFRVQHSVSLTLDSDHPEIARWERESYVKSISCVALMVLLAAESLGLGACYMTGPLLAEAGFAKRIGVRRGFEIGAVIPVGRPKRND